MGCAGPDAFRVTFEGETGTERIPDDCFSSGKFCQLPRASTPVAITRRYAAYVGDTISTAQVTVDACYGDISIYGCRGTASPVEKCNPVSMPGPQNYDTLSTSAGNPNATASFSATLSGLFYLGAVGTAAAPLRPAASLHRPPLPFSQGIGASGNGVTDGIFQMMIGSPNALVLTLPPGQAMTAAYTDASETAVRCAGWGQGDTRGVLECTRALLFPPPCR